MKKLFCFGVSLVALFILWTLLINSIDVKAIGPNDSSVGFATINGFIHRITGVHMSLYTVTDWLGLVPIFFGFGFAILGLCQWIKRKKLNLVDFDVLALGIFYIIVISVYVLFEIYAVNYRPVLINGFLEVSYPSSTTILVMTVMPTAIMLLNGRIKNNFFKALMSWTIIFFIGFMVIGRLISGVHWFTDIIGGAIISAGLDLIFFSLLYGR